VIGFETATIVLGGNAEQTANRTLRHHRRDEITSRLLCAEARRMECECVSKAVRTHAMETSTNKHGEALHSITAFTHRIDIPAYSLQPKHNEADLEIATRA
jgi:hypothetical protein